VWPLEGTNTVLNVVPQGERFVVERLGKLLEIKESGWFLGTFVSHSVYIMC
jgi:regulator of protease activity HflC (stomatin/prohibitin superfamily)